MIGIISKSMMYVLHQNKYFVNCLWTFALFPHISQVQQNSLLKMSWSGDDFSEEPSFGQKKSVKCFKTEKCNR